jgi:hypothetical protein
MMAITAKIMAPANGNRWAITVKIRAIAVGIKCSSRSRIA